MVFTAQRSYASAVWGVVILSVRPCVRPSVCPSGEFPSCENFSVDLLPAIMTKISVKFVKKFLCRNPY